MNDIVAYVKTQLKVDTCEVISRPKGGIVNAGKAAVIKAGEEHYFIKHNDTPLTKQMFHCEFSSLQAIAATNTVSVPKALKLLNHPTSADGSILLLENLPDLSEITDDSLWEQLGVQVAQLHAHNKNVKEKLDREASSIHFKIDETHVNKFGFESAHFFGPVFHVPPGLWETSWTDYFCRHIIDALVQCCLEQTGDRAFEEAWKNCQSNVSKIIDSANITIPSLLHGDLFDINVGQCDGKPVIFDPQSWYADSEIEVNSELPAPFHKGYRSVIPQPSDHTERQKVYDFMTALIYCTCVKGEELDKFKTETLSLSEEIVSL